MYPDSETNIQKCIGKEIHAIALTDDVLVIIFSDSSVLELKDNGQSCCETRYMTTDDDLFSYKGSKLVSVDIADATEAPDSSEDQVHEVMFLRVYTDNGVLVCATHNEHNGYYGGFSIEAEYHPATRTSVVLSFFTR